VTFTILRQNNDRQLTCPHVCANSDLCAVTVSLRVCNTCHGALRLQPTNRAVKLGRPVGRRYKCISILVWSVYTRDARIKHSRQTMLKPTHIKLFCSEILNVFDVIKFVGVISILI